MKQHQANENAISGWANQNQFNQDAIVLTNILQRKSKIKPLPHLSANKTKQQTINSKNLSQKLGKTLDKLQNQSNDIIKAQRDRSENSQVEGNDSTMFYKAKKFIAITQQAQQYPSFSPFINNRKNTEQIKPQQSIFQEGKMSPFYKYQKWDGSKNVFSKTMKLNKHNTKSHQFIIHKVASKFEKIYSKLSLKPNNFQMGNLKSKSKSRRNVEGQQCLSEQRQLVLGKEKRNNSRMEVDCKKTSKYKNILAKRNILVKKASSKDQAEFSDQIIFSNNSIIVNKQFVNNPYLQSKIQIIKQPQRYPIMFNK